MKRLVLLLLLHLTVQGFAQDYKRTFNWYFGDSLGLNFSSGSPAVTQGNIGKVEGTAAISDTSGQLLFYTNGVTVWNKNNQVMQNGNGLKGHISSTQAALIVPQPGNDSLFYVFTTDAVAQANGLQYSLVNMMADNGLGAVIVKNVLLQTPVCEKLCATKHQNGKDVWVLAHGFGDNTFYCYLLTDKGLVSCPLISNIGSTHGGSGGADAQGAMKFSIDGKKLAVCVYTYPASFIDLFNFDNGSGKIYDFVPISNILLPLEIEFSQSSKHIYVATRTNDLIAYNISNNNITDIESSKTILADYQNLPWILVGLQMGIDSKIYVFNNDSFYLGVIAYPDSGGINSGYNLSKISTGARRVAGNPNFISSYFYRPSLDFSYTRSCNSLVTIFTGASFSTPTNWSWTFKQLSTNNSVASNGSSVSYTFPDSGSYEVRLVAGTDTVIKQIYIEGKLPPLNDSLGCGVDSVVLIANLHYRCVVWNDTLASNRYAARESGWYTVQGYNSLGCLIHDSIQVKFFASVPAKPIVSRLIDSITSTLAPYYQWFFNGVVLTNANHQRHKPAQNGWYTVLVTDSNGCSNTSDSFYVGFTGIQGPSYSSMSIYPNPTHHELTIELNTPDEQIASVKLWDVRGKLVKQLVEPGGSRLIIPCQGLATGMYILQLNTTKQNLYHNKIVIQ